MRCLTLEIGSGEHPDLTFQIHNDIRDDQPHVEVVGHCMEIDLPAEGFSLIKLNQVYEHFNAQDQGVLLKRIKNWLTPGGGLIIYTPDLDEINAMDDADPWKQKLLEGGRTNPFDYHIGLVGKARLGEQLTKNGYEVVELETTKGSVRALAVKSRVW